MNKKVSKALAAVLSAAMAASAFAMSTGASFAATAAGSPVTFKVADIPLNLTTATANAKVDLDATYDNNTNPTALAGAWKQWVTAEKDGQTFEIQSLETIPGEEWTSSNTDLATIATNGQITIVKKDVTSRQEVTFTKKYKATIATNAYENDKHTVKGGGDTATVTVKFVASIYPDGSKMILPAGTTMGGNDEITANQEVSINETADFNVYTVTADASTGFAKLDAGTDSGYTYAISGNLSTISTTGVVAAQDPANVKTGTATITATNAAGENIQAASVTVEKSYAFDTNDQLSVNTQYGEERATLAKDNSLSKTYDVTGMDIDASVALTLDDGETVGNITGGDVTVNNGTAGNITASGTVTINNDSAADPKTAAVTVGNIDADDINITGSDDAEGAAITVGNITDDADKDSTVDIKVQDATSNGQKVAGSEVTVGNITTAGKLTLTAGDLNTMTLGALSGVQGYYADCPYTAQLVVTDGTFDLGNLPYFGNVDVQKNANVTVGTINTGVSGTPDGGTSPADDVTSEVQVGGRLTADKIKTEKFAKSNSDAGTVIVPVNSVEVTNPTTGNTGITLLVKDAKVGDILYTSAVSSDDMFVLPGVAAVEGKDTGKNIFTYSVESLTFRGIMMEQTGTVEVSTAGTTLTLAKVPSTIELPEGVSIVWETNKPNSVKLTPSADGLSCKVDAIGYTENNLNGSNDVTVTATVYKDGKPYTALETQYAAATVDLTLTGKAPEAPANPFTVVVTNAEGKKITCAADGSTVIEVPQSMAFNFDISSAETVSSFDYTVGNGHVGGTNTIQPDGKWNGTSGKYQIYAAGAVGSETGAYVNGIKIFTLKVTARPFTSDTTINMDLKVGQKYQFEITLDDPTASFTFLTADGKALSTSYNKDTYPAANGKYYCSVTAQQAGRDIGVYCVIGGKTYKIFTAHTIA